MLEWSLQSPDYNSVEHVWDVQPTYPQQLSCQCGANGFLFDVFLQSLIRRRTRLIGCFVYAVFFLLFFFFSVDPADEADHRLGTCH